MQIVEHFATEGICEARKHFNGPNGITGLVPQDTRAGDIICILGNSDIPFVLRHVGRYYELLGDGYIDVENDLSVYTQPELKSFHLQ